MKIDCLHGYFIFEEMRPGELSDFVSLYGLKLARAGDHFTFDALKAVPKFSLKGQSFMSNAALTSYAGKPWEIFEANDLVYSWDVGKVVPISTITARVDVLEAGKIFVSNGLILPGSLTDEGLRVKQYAAWFSFDTQKFRYSEVGYVD